MDLPRQRFGMNLRRLIDARGLTLEQVGMEALGWEAPSARANISTFCAGRKMPSDDVLMKLAEYLEVDDIVEFFKPPA